MRLFIVGATIDSHTIVHSDSPAFAGDLPAEKALAAWRDWDERNEAADIPHFPAFWCAEEAIWVATSQFDHVWPERLGPFFGPENSVGGVPRALGHAVDSALRAAHERAVASLSEHGCRLTATANAPASHNTWWAEPSIRLANGIEALPDRVCFALPGAHFLFPSHRGDNFHEGKDRAGREMDRFFENLASEISVAFAGVARLAFTAHDVDAKLANGPIHGHRNKLRDKEEPGSPSPPPERAGRGDMNHRKKWRTSWLQSFANGRLCS